MKNKTIVDLGTEVQGEIIAYLRISQEEIVEGHYLRVRYVLSTEEEGDMQSKEDLMDTLAEANEAFFETWREVNETLWAAVAGVLEYDTALEIWNTMYDNFGS